MATTPTTLADRLAALEAAVVRLASHRWQEWDK